MRIAHFGTFDVENYGDLLFPLVLERRLVGRGHELIHVSPIGGDPVWGDCVATVSTREAMTLELDGVIIGGGHLIHGQPSDVPHYRDSGDRGLFAYVDLWLGSTLRAGELGVPVVWNAPGVPGPLPSETAELLCWAAGQAGYVAVRDETSRGFIERAGFGGEVAVALDTAIEVSELWSREELDAAWRDAFHSRGLGIPEAAIAVHFNGRFLSDGIADTAARLDALSRAWSATPILLALGPCHGDAALQQEISQAMAVPHLLIDAPRSLREIAACIRGARHYLGSSLHGAVTARAFGRPAVIVAREADGGHAKFSQFLALHAQLIDCPRVLESVRVDSWSEGWARAERLLRALSQGEGGGDDPDPDRLGGAVERHWGALVDALEGRSTMGRQSSRAGLSAFEALCASRWRREGTYVGVLLDQAREAARYRETSQKNAQRFRQLERLHRDLKESIRVERSNVRRADVEVDGDGKG